jgi:hypothetical protein
MIPLGKLVTVYVAFVFKHLAADFALQTGWMARGKASPTGWMAPLAAHAGIHAAGTLFIVLIARPSLWWLGPVDFVIHCVIDRGKALVTRRLNITMQDRGFWWSIGVDQALHQLTHFTYVLLIVAS